MTLARQIQVADLLLQVRGDLAGILPGDVGADRHRRLAADACHHYLALLDRERGELAQRNTPRAAASGIEDGEVGEVHALRPFRLVVSTCTTTSVGCPLLMSLSSFAPLSGPPAQRVPAGRPARWSGRRAPPWSDHGDEDGRGDSRGVARRVGRVRLVLHDPQHLLPGVRQRGCVAAGERHLELVVGGRAVGDVDAVAPAMAGA